MASNEPPIPPAGELLDVAIVGAGLSGIGAAMQLQQKCPGKRFAILEARAAIGGTWDLFRYPGIRSDSDMYTLGYLGKPWRDAKAIADGPAIRAYVEEAADEHGLRRHIRFGRKVTAASWSSAEARWTLTIDHAGQQETLRARFLYLCSGYYSYDEAYRPRFDGEDDFRGRIVQPQFWPQDLDWRGKQVVVIGSGATAVTIVPAMSAEAAHVTMLQRSPTYVVARPARDAVADFLRRFLPAGPAYALARWKNILESIVLYRLARTRPDGFKRMIVGLAAKEIGRDLAAAHFTPHYKPWDQRLCVVPDGDMFAAIRAGRASVVTDHITRFTAEGLLLRSGRTLPADIVVMATGLQIKVLGGMRLTIDGQDYPLQEGMAYKGMMLSDVPNMAMAFGYTNASWTLKADLTAGYVCRLLRHMDRHGHAIAVPRRDPSVAREPFLSFTSGYVQRALHLLPAQGARRPWQVYQNYLQDLFTIRYGRLADGVMRFGAKGRMP